MSGVNGAAHPLSPGQVAAIFEHGQVRAHARQTGSDSTWLEQDLDRYVSGDYSPEPPSILCRVDGPALLYPGKLHLVVAEPESAKTLMVLRAALEVAHAGRHVLFVDFESDAAAIVALLKALGATAEDFSHIHYVRPEEPLSDSTWLYVEALAQACSLIVLDGMTEALTLHGCNLNDNSEVATFMQAVPRRLQNAGTAAEVLIDHVSKDRDTRSRYAIGAQHKLAAVDVAYALTVKRPFGHGLEGVIEVDVKKDRPGLVRSHALGDQVALMRLLSRDDGSIELKLEPPVDGEFRPTLLMERVSRAIESASDGFVIRDLEGVKGKTDAKRSALRILVSEGYVTVAREGRAHVHSHVRPYRAEQVGECS